MRILMTVPSLGREFGGPIGKASDLSDALRHLGHDVVLIGAGESAERRTIALGSRGAFHATPVPAQVRPIRVAVQGADVVHVIGYRDPVGTVAALEAKRVGVPYVMEPAGMLQPRLRSFVLKRAFGAAIGRSLISGAGRLIVASSVEAADLARQGVRAERITVRPNGVDFDALLPLPHRGPLRKRLGIPPQAPLVVSLARISAIKGLPRLAHALGSLEGVWWLLAGPDGRDGTLRAVRAAVADAAMENRAVVHTDGLWRQDKRAALSEADVFCLASDYESFGTAAAEAAGAGVPVVVTNGCGVRDVLQPALPRTVATGDEAELRAAVDAILSDPIARERSAAAAPAIRTRLDWVTLASQQVAIYESV